MSVPITITNLLKRYGEHVVIPDLSLEVNRGEFFTLLGPSGCGKTTLLRMIAGFIDVERGEVRFGNELMNEVPVYRRDFGMVFQNYAIFPNMTVEENVEYGLKNRKIPRSKISARVHQMLEKVRMDTLHDRRPENLSGGQQQRVALARAVVIQPRVLLMDEPLSNLDAKLRVEIRKVISEIQREVGITTIYVTHDQEEALAISDRIAVMDRGEIQQIDSPEELYRRPYNEFVANFIGKSNSLAAQVLHTTPGQVRLRLENTAYECMVPNVDEEQVKDSNITLSVRPEEFAVTSEPSELHGKVILKQFLGTYVSYEVRGPGGIQLEVSQSADRGIKIYEPGDRINLGLSLDRVNLFGADGVSVMKGVTRNGCGITAS